MTKSDIASWLANQGLAQYVELFERNGVDLRSLPLLSDADLSELGVLLGHRKLLKKAIEQYSASVTVIEPAATPGRPERRQLTVLFCDLVGSTALAELLDAEELREVMHAYQREAGAVIDRYDGHVAQYLGDGLMVYFGFPHAHEDDAERAVRAALEIVAAVPRIESARELCVRVGIATGPVVVGETGAGDASVPKVAVGTTPNLAARLQALAGAGEIVIAPGTRRLLGNAFEFDDLGQVSLKGIAEPVGAARVVGITSTESRFEASRSVGRTLTPLVGREAEIAHVLAAWRQARSGHGRALLVCGEPGIGKSRLLHGLRERIADEPHLWLRYQCSPYHTGSAFHPIIEQLERAAGFQREDGVEARPTDHGSALRATRQSRQTGAGGHGGGRRTLDRPQHTGYARRGGGKALGAARAVGGTVDELHRMLLSQCTWTWPPARDRPHTTASLLPYTTPRFAWSE